MTSSLQIVILRVPTITWKSPAGALFARSESFSNTNVLFRKRRNIEDPGINTS